MAVKQKKRRWSDEEKRSICFQTMVAGVSVAQVARRYAMNANLIFKWLRDERYAPELDAAAEEVEPVFLPIEAEAANCPPPVVATRRWNRAAGLRFAFVVLVLIINRQINVASFKCLHKNLRIGKVEGAPVAARHHTVRKQMHPFRRIFRCCIIWQCAVTNGGCKITHGFNPTQKA